jgi:hypothetical protein
LKKLLLFLLIGLSACMNIDDKSSENVLARVYDEYLYESDIEDLVPSGTSVKDSLSIAQGYINNWISQQLVLHKAKKNLKEEDKQFDKQLQEYKNSLITYQYESKLIRQQLDTIVSNEEIEKYYNGNIGNFELKNNIVKAYYARFRKDGEHIKKTKKFFYSKKTDARDSLEKYIENYSDLYFLDDESWILFDDLLKFVPIEAYNQEAYLKNHRKIELTDDQFFYLVNFSDFRIKEGTSPLSFEKGNIRQILINKRKLQVLKKMRQDIFDQAQQNNDFEIY